MTDTDGNSSDESRQIAATKSSEGDAKVDSADTPVKQPTSETVQRAVRKLQERVPESVTEIAMMMGGQMGHPLHQKMTEAHITKMLDLSVQHDTNEHDLKAKQQQIEATNDWHDKCFNLVYFCLFIGLVIFIISMFYWQPAVLVPILTGVGGAVTGFIGGMGYAKSKQAAEKSRRD